MNLLNHLRRRAHEAVNWRLRTFAGGRLAEWTRPPKIGILLTLRCNARCIHCEIWKNRGAESVLSAEQWTDLLTHVRRWLGPVHVFLSGGEALLRPYTTSLVAHGANLGLFVELLTHGYWEDQARIEDLARANPWRVTVSLDAAGDSHSLIRGHADFWQRTSRTIDILCRIRSEERRTYGIRLKTVVMQQNLEDVAGVAHFARDKGIEVFYQPIERHYNTPDNPTWYESVPTWPKDSQQAVAVVKTLLSLQEQGFPICNSRAELDVMVDYFRDPAGQHAAVKRHTAHETRQSCVALAMVEIRPNGDVFTCSRMPPVGNISEKPLREIWRERPRWWRDGSCCEQTAPTE